MTVLLNLGIGELGQDLRLVRSTDEGTLWSSAALDEPVEVAAGDPFNDQVVFVGGPLGASKTIDGGAMWTPAGRETLSSTIVGIAVDPLLSTRVYVAAVDGSYRSDDGGGVWTRTSEMTVSKLLAVGTTTGTKLFGFTRAFPEPEQLLRSVDGGESWEQRANAGLVTERVEAFRAAVATGELVVGTADAGVLVSSDDGKSWMQRNGGLPGHSIDGLAVAGETIYAASCRDGVFVTHDGGSTWANRGLAGAVCSTIVRERAALAVLSSDPLRIFAGGYRSVDGGQSWEPSVFAGFEVAALAIYPSNPSVVFAGLFPPDGYDCGGTILRSDDGGASFDVQSLPCGPEVGVWAFAVDPLDSKNVYAATNRAGVWKSTDGGATWNESNVGLPDLQVTAIAVDPSNPATVYAGLWSGGGRPAVARSDDGGATWHATTLRYDGPSLPYVRGIVSDSSRGRTYVATGDGLFLTTDGGVSWHLANSGLTDRVTGLAAAGDDALLAGTDNESIVRLRISECTSNDDCGGEGECSPRVCAPNDRAAADPFGCVDVTPSCCHLANEAANEVEPGLAWAAEVSCTLEYLGNEDICGGRLARLERLRRLMARLEGAARQRQRARIEQRIRSQLVRLKRLAAKPHRKRIPTVCLLAISRQAEDLLDE